MRKDKVEAKYELRQVLDKYAGRYGIDAKAVNGPVYGYVDDMLSDLFYDKEEALRDEVEHEIERENQR